MEEKKKHGAAYEHKPKGKGGKYLLPLAAALSLIILTNVVVVSLSNGAIDEKINRAKDLAKPAELQITKIAAQCTDCFDISVIVSAIKQFKATIKENALEPASTDAKALIAKYNITKLPTIIVKGDAEKAGLSPVWKSVGTQESDGALVLRVGAPFVDVASGEIRGKADVILLNYSSCAKCYDVTLHEGVLKRYGVAVSSNRTVDAGSAEGRALIEKYNITKVPTVLVSPDAKYYDALIGIWQQVGSKELDGWYVFRAMEAMQGATYYDLAQKKEINQTAQQPVIK